MKLKTSMLFEIIGMENKPSKYTETYKILSALFEIETKLDEQFKQKFDKIKETYNSFKNGIPLIIIERYYIPYANNLNHILYIEYKKNQLNDISVSELYTELELFFNEMYTLAVLIADKYNLEIKINQENKTEKKVFG